MGAIEVRTEVAKRPRIEGDAFIEQKVGSE